MTLSIQPPAETVAPPATHRTHRGSHSSIPSPRGRYYSPEPLPPELIVQTLDTLRMVRRRLATYSEPDSCAARLEIHNLRDEDSATRFIGQAWEATTALLCRNPHNPHDLIDALSQLRRLESKLAASRRAAAVDMHERTNEALTRLSRCDSAADLMQAIPQQVIRLGFDRALFSVVTGGTWRPRSIHSRAECAWAAFHLDEHRDIALTLPAAAASRRAVHVDETTMLARSQRDPGFILWQRSRSKSFWMVPIVHEFRVVGIIHADCRFRGRPPSKMEVDALEQFCRQLPLVFTHRVATDTVCGPHMTYTAPSTVPAPTIPATEGHGRCATTGPDSEGALSQREVEVVALMAEGLTNAQIGRRLTITEGTVKSHVKRILRKTESANRAEAVANWMNERRLAPA